MRYLLTVIFLLMAAGTFVLFEDRRQDKLRDRQIQALEEKVGALQLAGTGRIPVPVYDGVPVKTPKTIKY